MQSDSRQNGHQIGSRHHLADRRKRVDLKPGLQAEAGLRRGIIQYPPQPVAARRNHRSRLSSRSNDTTFGSAQLIGRAMRQHHLLIQDVVGRQRQPPRRHVDDGDVELPGD